MNFHRGRYPGRFNEMLSGTMLTCLDNGMITKFRYHNALKERVNVFIYPVNFQQAYQKYVKCVGNLLPFQFRDVHSTLVYFDYDSRRLDGQARYKLRKVVEYTLADPKVSKVEVVGFSDNRGRKGHNMYLSELRAKSVKKYLLKQGIPEQILKINWLGVKKPIGLNDTPAGRALNRRVWICIHRDG